MSANARLSPYERAVNRLNDLPRGLDRIFTEALEDMRAQRDTARAEGVAAERARVVAWLRAADSETLVWFAAQRIEQGWHDKEGT